MLGYPNIANHVDSWYGWQAGPPVVAAPTYPNEDLLVSGEWLQANLAKPGLVIIDTRKPAYDTGHIPGAINIAWPEFSDAQGLMPPVQLGAKLGALGVSETSKIVIYDDTVNSWGAAGRLFWMLEYLGHKDVHLLNGGWDKWSADAKPTETTARTLPATNFNLQVRPQVLATKEGIASRLGASDFAVLDTREDEEYNGWTLYGEARGGHIPGAVNVNYHWFYKPDKTVLGYEELGKLLTSRGITPDKEVASYCTAGIRSGFAYFALRLMGYPRASNYAASIKDWAATSGYPMAKMPNHQMLVYPGWLKALIAGGNPGTAGTPATYPGQGFVVLHVAPAAAPYDTGHIPGALWLNHLTLEKGGTVAPYAAPSDQTLIADAALQQALGNLGITADTTVVVYGVNMVVVGRVLWELMYAGVKDVRALNGGYAAWTASGGAVETTANTPVPVSFGAVSTRADYVVTSDEAKTLRQDPTGRLVDIRSWAEYVGTSALPAFGGMTRGGHIPGAVWGGDLVATYFDADGTFRSYEEVQKYWQQLGATPDKRVGFT